MEFLRINKISKYFGEVMANNNINFSVNEGEVHTLLGENGAGKSTLMNIIIGLYQPTEGSIYIRGKRVKIDNPAKAVKFGIGMVHQHFMLVDSMTVFENIILGKTKEKSIFIKKDIIKKELADLSQKYGLNVELDKYITDISVGEQQRVEILKALYRGAELLILDEPTAALTDIEVKGLFKIIRKLIAEKKSVIFISHKMREVLEISDRITILRRGETVKTLKKEETDSKELANLMIGREITESRYEKVKDTKEKVMEFRDISYNSTSKHNGLSHISFSIGKGEIIGIAGIDGNGQSQLAQIATGVIKPESGEVDFKTEKISKFSPQKFIDLNISHIPEDRNKMGLIGNMTIKENIVLKDIEDSKFSIGNGFFIKKRKISEYVSKLKEKYDIRCESIDEETRNLSGGNQQKVILAREMEQKPDLIVAVHPTRGLDIGATNFVHDQMIDARKRGCSIMLISADLDEILKMSDRIVVMFEGRITGIFSGENPPLDNISLAMSGKHFEEMEEMCI